ncbi:peptidylprolyl isomerase [Deltaproteobacteria bacterium TL4]
MEKFQKSIGAKLGMSLLLVFFSGTLSLAQALSEGLFAKMVTSKGAILFELFYDKTPRTVANFIALAEGKVEWHNALTSSINKTRFYDGLTFHRVVKEQLVQGGDPSATGLGGPGYQILDEFRSDLTFNTPGMLSTIHMGPDAHGSQFFITLKPLPSFNQQHTVFGKVVGGMAVLKVLEQGDQLEKVVILRKGTLARQFEVETVLHPTQTPGGLITQLEKELSPALNEPEPSRIPQANQPMTSPIALSLLVIGYQGVRISRFHAIYDKKAAWSIAKRLVELARQPETDFEELIERYTDLPQFTRIPTLRAEETPLPHFLSKALVLKEGQVSAPYDSPLGYVILKRVPLRFYQFHHLLITYQGAWGSDQTRSRAEALLQATQLKQLLQNSVGYRFTSKVQNFLEQNRISEEKIRAVQLAETQIYYDDTDFLCAAETILGSEQTEAYRTSLLKFAFMGIRYKLTEQALEDIKNHGNFYDVLLKLKTIEKQKYTNEESFVRTLTEILGKEELQQYRSLIFKYAHSSSGFQMDAQVLSQIRKEGDFFQMLLKLNRLKDREYQDEDELRDALIQNLGIEQTERYQALIRDEAQLNFKTLVKAYSDAPATRADGTSGILAKGTLESSFEKVIYRLKYGEVSDIVETPWGFHLLLRQRLDPGKDEHEQSNALEGTHEKSTTRYCSNRDYRE